MNCRRVLLTLPLLMFLNPLAAQDQTYRLRVQTIDVDGETKTYTYFSTDARRRSFENALSTNIRGWVCSADFDRRRKMFFELGCIPTTALGKDAKFSRVFTRGSCPSAESINLIVNTDDGPADRTLRGLSISAECF